MNEKPEGKIIKLMRDGSTGRMTAAPQTSVNITGSGNFVAGRDFHLHQEASKPPRPKVVVQTGIGVIDPKQKAELTRKLSQWLTARNACA